MGHKRGEASASGADVVRKAYNRLLACPDVGFGPDGDHLREMTRSLLGSLWEEENWVRKGFIIL